MIICLNFNVAQENKCKHELKMEMSYLEMNGISFSNDS